MVKQAPAKKKGSFAAMVMVSCSLGGISSRGGTEYLLNLVHAESEPAGWDHASC